MARKELQAKIKQLEADNAKLKNGWSNLEADPGGISVKDSKEFESLFTPAQSSSTGNFDKSSVLDESLLVELPSFHEGRSKSTTMSSSPVLSKPRITTVKSHPTARTYSIEPGMSVSDFNATKKRKHSKYFEQQQGLEPSETDTELDEDPSDILIEASSPPRAPPAKRSTNPFPSSKEDQKSRSKLKTRETIDLCSTDSDPTSPAKPSSPLRRKIPKFSGLSVRSIENRNANEILMSRVADKNGRPRKGVVTGSKSRIR